METLFEDIKQQIRSQLETQEWLSDAELMERIEAIVLEKAKGRYISSSEKYDMVLKIFYSFRGLDLLQPLLDDPEISEIMVNDYNEIFVEKHGEMVRHHEQFENREKLEDLIQLIVGKVNRVVNESVPIVDARLADGSRVNVVLPPVALNGPTLTIRKFPKSVMTLEKLSELGTIPPSVSSLLKLLVQAKYNLFIGGGTGSGKTTLLNALAQCIPSDERIITIEDSAELRIEGITNLVRLETRNRNTEGKGEITIRDLIRTSLRMRPNRIIIGEVRGAEAYDMLQAMNTGHEGALSTAHANSVKDMLSRLEMMVLSAAALPLEVIRKQIVSAIDIMIHLSRMRDRSRKVMEISEIAGIKNGEIVLNPLFVFKEDTNHSNDLEDKIRVNGCLTATGHSLHHKEKLKQAGLIEQWEAAVQEVSA